MRAPQAVAPVRDDRTGRPAFLVTAAIPGLGLVAAFVDLTALGAAAGKLFGGARHLEFLITTEDHTTVVTRWPDGLRWAGARLRDTRFEVSGAGVDVTGLPRLYGRAAVEGIGWQVFAGADRSAALADADRLARRQALIVALGLFAGLLATVVVQRRVTAPICNLRAAVHNATTSGNLDTTIAITGPREVAELGAEFTALLATVDRELQERRRAEEAAREHERNYRQMFDASPNPIVLFDADTLDIVAANAAAAAYYGRPDAPSSPWPSPACSRRKSPAGRAVAPRRPSRSNATGRNATSSTTARSPR